MYKVLLGIEHLMTGVMVRAKETEGRPNDPLIFERESPSVIRVLCDSPIEVYWPVTQGWINSEEIAQPTSEKYSHGEAEWYAKVVGPAMVDCDRRSYDMQVYARRPEYPGPDGIDSRYAPGEPSSFPEAVVKAMRRKHGAEADKFLAQLKWDRDHWFYVHNRMYLGVEPDGYIHS